MSFYLDAKLLINMNHEFFFWRKSKDTKNLIKLFKPIDVVDK